MHPYINIISSDLLLFSLFTADYISLILDVYQKAARSYQKDIATFQKNSNAHALEIKEDGEESTYSA